MRLRLPSPRHNRWLGPVLGAGLALSLSWVIVGPLRLTGAAAGPLSQGKPVTASSSEGAHWSAGAAVDGDLTTRWSSTFADPQYLQVDLGAPAVLDRVVLDWEAAYATSFQIMVSTDGNDFTPVYTTTTAAGGNQTIAVTGTGRYVRMYGTKRATAYGYSLFEFQVYGTFTTDTPSTSPDASASATPSTVVSTSASATPTVSAATSAPPTTGGNGYVMADPPVTGVTPSTANPPHRYFHEFQANCAVSHHQPDDPIVFPNLPGASHDHTFMGNLTTNAATTEDSLLAGDTLCKVPGDKSGYWMPTLLDGDKVVLPNGPQTIYYKTGVNDYTSVRPFPPGLRFVVGSPKATADQFANAPGYVAGWECGDSYHNIDFPASCPAGQELNIRMQAPSCWDGIHLDTPDHKSHMTYAVNGVCPADHPVALPMIEFKMAFPVSGDLSNVRLASGHGYSFHYDFYNAWVPATLAAMVTQCIDGGLQCDARGYDQTNPQNGAALDDNYQVPGTKTELSRTGWTATASTGGDAANMVDASKDTRWTSGASMANGQSITVDLKAAHPVSMINLLASGDDYPRGYTVALSTDGQTWTTVDSSEGFMSQTVITFAQHTARYLKITQTGTASNWWSVADLTAYSDS